MKGCVVLKDINNEQGIRLNVNYMKICYYLVLIGSHGCIKSSEYDFSLYNHDNFKDESGIQIRHMYIQEFNDKLLVHISGYKSAKNSKYLL